MFKILFCWIYYCYLENKHGKLFIYSSLPFQYLAYHPNFIFLSWSLQLPCFFFKPHKLPKLKNKKKNSGQKNTWLQNNLIFFPEFVDNKFLSSIDLQLCISLIFRLKLLAENFSFFFSFFLKYNIIHELEKHTFHLDWTVL